MSRLVHDALVGGRGLRFVVDPAELAPWTPDFWALVPTAEQVDQVYRLEREGTDTAVVVTPAGRERLALAEAPGAWDALMRNLLRYHSGHGVLHAALLLRGERAVLVLGASGRGKSTLTRAALAAGWRYAADDAVRLDAAGLVGLPRPLEWDRCDDLPAWVSPRWCYATAAGRHGFGHASDRWVGLVPWSWLRAVVELAPERSDRAWMRPARPRWRRAWLTPPSWRQWPQVRALRGLPGWRLIPGTPESTVSVLEVLVAGWR